MKLQIPQTTSNMQTLPELTRFISIMTDQMQTILNGGLDFDNFNVATIPVLFQSTGTNYTLEHNLNRIPSGFVIIDKNTPVDVFRTAPYTTKTLTVQASAAPAQVLMLVF